MGLWLGVGLLCTKLLCQVVSEVCPFGWVCLCFTLEGLINVCYTYCVFCIDWLSCWWLLGCFVVIVVVMVSFEVV